MVMLLLHMVITQGYCIVHAYCTWLFLLVIVCCVHEQSGMSFVGQTCLSVSLFICSPSSPSEELNSLMARGKNHNNVFEKTGLHYVFPYRDIQ